MLRRVYLAIKKALQQNNRATKPAHTGARRGGTRRCTWCGRPIYPGNSSVTSVYDRSVVYHTFCHTEMIVVLGL